jgi:hypothetical protein
MGNDLEPQTRPVERPLEIETVWDSIYSSLFGPPEPTHVVSEIDSAFTQEAIAKYVSENQQPSGYLFGRELTEVLELDLSLKVPTLCYRAAIHICQPKFLSQEGLFRVSGQRAEVFKLRQLFNEGKEIDFSGADVHDVCTIFKQFIREMPTPMIPVSEFLPICDNGDENTLLQLVSALPPSNASLLEFICRVLRIISTYAEQNMMTVENLAIAIAPSIFPVEDSNPVNFLNKTRQAIGVTEMLLRNHGTIFVGVITQDFDPSILHQSIKATVNPVEDEKVFENPSGESVVEVPLAEQKETLAEDTQKEETVSEDEK